MPETSPIGYNCICFLILMFLLFGSTIFGITLTVFGSVCLYDPQNYVDLCASQTNTNAPVIFGFGIFFLILCFCSFCCCFVGIKRVRKVIGHCCVFLGGCLKI